jgi:hypothetical protein
MADVAARRPVENFSQAFTHVPLVNTVRSLTLEGGPVERCGEEHEASARHSDDVPASSQCSGLR